MRCRGRERLGARGCVCVLRIFARGFLLVMTCLVIVGCLIFSCISRNNRLQRFFCSWITKNISTPHRHLREVQGGRGRRSPRRQHKPRLDQASPIGFFAHEIFSHGQDSGRAREVRGGTNHAHYSPAQPTSPPRALARERQAGHSPVRRRTSKRV